METKLVIFGGSFVMITNLGQEYEKVVLDFSSEDLGSSLVCEFNNKGQGF